MSRPGGVPRQLYRANHDGLPVLVAAVSPDVRVSLALFCYRRSHLHAIGLAIAASCDEEDLVRSAASAQLSLPDQEKRSSRCLTRHIHAIRGRSLWLRGTFDTSLLSVMTAQTWRSAISLPEYDFLDCAVSTELNLVIRRPLLLGKTIAIVEPRPVFRRSYGCAGLWRD